MKNVCVFLSAYNVDEKYRDPALRLANLLVAEKYGLVYGGSERGMMKLFSGAVQKAGGRVYGVSCEAYKDWRKMDADDMVVAKSLNERKKIMGEKSEAFVILPGGIGTLDEVFEFLETKKQGVHRKPIIFFNTDNFYGGLREQLTRMNKEGFIPKELDELAYFAESPEEVIEYLRKNI